MWQKEYYFSYNNFRISCIDASLKTNPEEKYLCNSYKISCKFHPLIIERIFLHSSNTNILIHIWYEEHNLFTWVSRNIFEMSFRYGKFASRFGFTFVLLIVYIYFTQKYNFWYTIYVVHFKSAIYKPSFLIFFRIVLTKILHNKNIKIFYFYIY